MLAEAISFAHSQIAAVYSYVLQFFFSVWWVLRLRCWLTMVSAIHAKHVARSLREQGTR